MAGRPYAFQYWAGLINRLAVVLGGVWVADLKIRNWDKWQSYRKDRGQPPWIKLHREVMRNPEWVSLSDAHRGQLVGIWLLAADRNGTIPESPTVIKRLCHLDAEPDIKLFMELGFIEHDARMTPERRQDGVRVTPERRQDDAPDTDTETDTEKHSSDKSDMPTGFTTFWKSWPATQRKTSKAECLKKWKARNLEPLAEKIIAHVEVMKKTESWRTGFEPAPLTYINQKRWEDGLPTLRAVSDDPNDWTTEGVDTFDPWAATQ